MHTVRKLVTTNDAENVEIVKTVCGHGTRNKHDVDLPLNKDAL